MRRQKNSLFYGELQPHSAQQPPFDQSWNAHQSNMISLLVSSNLQEMIDATDTATCDTFASPEFDTP